MSRFPKLSTLVKSAAVALVLGGATFATAMPAQAASPQFSFSFGIGNGGYWSGPSHRYCYSDRQVRNFLQRQGYDHIRFIDRRGRVVGARAERHNRDYRVWVDSCRLRIVNVERLRRR